MIHAEVAYARPDEQTLIKVVLPDGATVRQAIEISGVLKRFPEIDLTYVKTGIFSRSASLATLLRSGDRVEIYRPLQTDPKQARRLKAAIEKRRQKR